MKSITLTFNDNGEVEIEIRGYEAESPKVAADFEAALGEAIQVNWKPGAHAHVVHGKKVWHSH